MTHGKAKKDIYPTKLVQAQHFKHGLQLSIFLPMLGRRSNVNATMSQERLITAYAAEGRRG
jgi:hypothetical protein